MALEKTDRKTEIRHAALQEFISEGISGARMQAIADNIGVTKAMIHYYFDTKDNLFEEVFKESSEKLMTGLMNTLEDSTPLFQKVEHFIDAAIERFEQQPAVAGFIINELNRHPHKTRGIFQESLAYDASIFDKQLEKAASNYEVAPVSSQQVIANMLSLCMFPYAGRAFLQQVLAKENEAYNEFLSQRSDVIKDTIMNWLAG
jgi:AcrR family transcriptional regulator